MLIDNRFDNVKDWKKLENNSSKLSNSRKLDIEDKKINNSKEHIINPKNHKYNNTIINTLIIPNR